jgi:eukaryotic-like serine/threonine-protein kinase
MPVRIEPHSEPIAGYRLIERLGGGGFGEVWKCEAPGGLFKAIKFVYGDMDSVDDEDGSRAEQELKALNRVKTVHHPYILSLERYDIVEGQLMIVMELADRTLWDRFRECRSQGLPGIPRLELLGYMRETAEALDLMNDQFQLQHLDIKPQNLFLVFKHIKVADFGLVKDLGNKAAATITGGVTPVYAAPETFDGWLSRFSDQYSLAIVFQELLTGLRPFTGGTMRQLVLQHLQGVPDLNPLPAADRPIIGRALSKEPDSRYPNCVEFVQQLYASTNAVTPPAETPAAAPPATDDAAYRDGPQTRDIRGAGLGPRKLSDPPPDIGAGRPQVLPRRPDRDYVRTGTTAWPTPAPTLAPSEDTPCCPTPRPPGQAVRRGPAPAEPPPGPVGPIQPALIIGLGGIGLRTLAQLRHRLTTELAQPDELPMIRLVGIDTDPDAIQAASTADPGHGLQAAEMLATRLHRASHYLKPRDGKPASHGWLNGKLLYRIPRATNSAGLRPLGRLAFVDHFRSIAGRLETELQACSEAAAEPATSERLAPRGPTPRVYIVSCLAGNTGSGMFLDAAFAARNLLRRLGHPRAEVVGVFFVPAGEATSRPEALANAYAALTELQHFSHRPFAAEYETTEPNESSSQLRDHGTPFTRCVLLGLPRRTNANADAAIAQTLASAGEFLYRDLATTLGPTADALRHRSIQDAGPAAQPGPTFHAFGLGRLSWPRQPLLDKGARRMCRRLVESWMSKDARPIAGEMTVWAAEKWDAIGLRPEALIASLHERCEKIVKQPPDRMVTAITGPLGELMAARQDRPGGPLALGPAISALAELDALLGVPEECRAINQSTPVPGALETALAEATLKLADACEQRLTEQVVRVIEDPRFRLAGAEEALRQLSAATERALQSQETLANELHERAVQLALRAQKILEAPAPTNPNTNTSAWKLSFGRRTPSGTRGDSAAELLELIRQYPKVRYHALVLQYINRLYVGLRGQLSDQLREVGFCRQRLGELANLLLPPATAAAEPASSARVLLPVGCDTLDDALAQLEKDITRADLLALDEQIQVLIRQQYRALVNVCMGSAAMVRTLAPSMLARAQEFLGPRFVGTSVAELLLVRREGDEHQRTDEAVDELQEIYERAGPKNAPPRPDARIAVAILPDDPKGQELQAMLREDLAELTVIGADRPDEIVFYREQIHLGQAGLDQLGPIAQEAYRQRLAADAAGLHTRDDIVEWQPLAAAAH